MPSPKLTTEQMILVLKDPARLLEPNRAEPVASATPLSDQALTKILKEIELAIEQGSLSLAQQLVQIVERCDFRFGSDQQAWFLYHKGCLEVACGEQQSALQSLETSLQQQEISWCHYKLAELRSVDDGFSAYRHFQQALTTKPPLSQEAEAHASNWLTGFFEPSIYRRLNPELNQLSADQLFEHFEQFGFSEGRIAGRQGIERGLARLAGQLPADFDWKEYIDGNPDLQCLLTDKNTTISEAQFILSQHYVVYGKNEGRLYRKSPLALDTVSEEFYLRHKAHNTRRLSKILRDFMESPHFLCIGGSEKASTTIVVIVYNKAAYTLACLKSIAASARKDLHLIIVDNNSSDQTPELLARLEGNVTVINNKQNSHFLLACNQALELVQTEYLCFLNNDALLCEDTLDEALACLSRYQDQAIVGGKVLHADGYIQDAGSIVFSDGSCAGLGRRRDPGFHLYNFERTVDYISGAFFASTTGLIRRLGCFDMSYAPAYYEETDLCFRAAAQGIPILYCPLVTIHHYEFGSSSGNEWAIRQMATNQRLFCKVHAERLSTHLPAGLFSANSIDSLLHGHLKPGPKVLFIDDQIPERHSGSGFSRSSDVVCQLMNFCGFLTVYATDFERSRINALSLPVGVECIEDDLDYLGRIIRERHAFYDYIFVSREHNQQLFKTIASELIEIGISIGAKIIFDAESLFSIRHYTFTVLQDSGEHLRSLNGLDLVALAKEELSRFEMADCITCVSEMELEVIASTFPDKQCQLVGHCFPGFDDEDDFDCTSRDSLVFLGAIYDQFSPNHDSLEWLYNDLLPALGQLPEGLNHFVIAGNIKCDATLELIKEMQAVFPFVVYKGLVDDLPQLFSRARLFVAPTRYAAGIPHKVHLASSFGIPALTTSLIAEQIGWAGQEALLLADTPAEFADAVRSAFSDPSRLSVIRRHMIRAFNQDCDPVAFSQNIKDIVDGGYASS